MNKIFHERILLKNAPNIFELHKIKQVILIDNVHFYMYLHIASIESLAGNKCNLFHRPFLTSIIWFLNLAEAFRNDHEAACSTALRSATEKNGMGGYITVPCSSKMTQRSSTADWLKFYRRHQIGYDGTHTEQIFNFEITLCYNSCISYCKLVDTVNFDLYYCTRQLNMLFYILFNQISYKNNT